MMYLSEHKMSLTKSCMALAETPEVIVHKLFNRTVDWCKGGRTSVNLLTGEVEYSSVRHKADDFKQSNFVRNPYKNYKTTIAYFEGLNDSTIYRKPTVHCIVASLADSHRKLLSAAFDRDRLQNDRSEVEAMAELHHIDNNGQNNASYNILPCTPTEHDVIHNALNAGKSTYEALVIGLGEPMVHKIFGTEYFDSDAGCVYTAKLFGESYIARMAQQLSDADLPADCDCIRVKTLQGRHECISILGMSIWKILSALYTIRAVEIKPHCTGTACKAIM